MYRINYGNGQVSNSFATKTAALADYSQMLARGDLYVEYARVEKQVAPGEWRIAPKRFRRAAR